MAALGVALHQSSGLDSQAFRHQYAHRPLKLSNARRLRDRDEPLFHKAAFTVSTVESAPPALPAITLGSPFEVPIDRSSSPTSSLSSASTRAKHVPIVIPNYASFASAGGPSLSTASSASYRPPTSLNEERRDSASQSSAQGSFDSARPKPRHVEILIPEWAQPLQRLPSSTTTTPNTRTARPSGASPAPRSRSPGMAQVTSNLSRTNTLDSTILEPTAEQLNHDLTRNTSLDIDSAHSSQSSLYNGPPEASSEQHPAGINSRTPGSAYNSAAPSPPVQTAGLSSSPTSNNGRSGLVCNVYRTTGREPRPLVGATTTILGDKLYVFGGRRLTRTRPQLTADLYELDLIRRHWTKLHCQGDVPPPRYFHSVCPLGDTKLVCYGGMSPAILPSGQPTIPNQTPNPQDPQPEVVVMSDIHIYDIPTNTWTNVPTTDSPQGRYAHCASVLPSSAVFASANAPRTAIHHNPSSSDPNSGSIGISLDGAGGAEMVVVGGQDSANHYIEQISVFNLRSLKWTHTSALERSCGAYRSIVAPLSPQNAALLGRKGEKAPESLDGHSQSTTLPGGWSMLIYSNYNFLDVKLEMQVREPDGTLSEKPMTGAFTPPGLRFPNGGVANGHFVVCGTFLTSSKQEYALWALDLKSMNWSRIDTGPSNFSQGSWNRGVLWQRRNTFVILGNRKRSLVEDYNHRQINFTNVAMVELESFGLYDNPQRVAPNSGYQSGSSPLRNLSVPAPPSDKVPSMGPAGRQSSKAAEELGTAALGLSELSDMDFLAMGGERISVNSHVVARRWGPYFNQLLREGIVSAANEGTETATLRPGAIGGYPSRNSIVTITPSVRTAGSGNTTLVDRTHSSGNSISVPNGTAEPNVLSPPDARTPTNPSNRPRTLFLPHTQLTIQALVHYLYTSSLPPTGSHLCTPQILCSLLQLARPYRIDGLLEALIERLHSVLDGRNTAAIFNAAAMAAGGGDGVSFFSSDGRIGGDTATINAEGEEFGQRSTTAMGMTPVSEGSDTGEATGANASGAKNSSGNLRINTDVTPTIKLNGRGSTAGGAASEDEPLSAASERSDAISGSDLSASEVSGSEMSGSEREPTGKSRAGTSKSADQSIWNGELSAVIGLQKRGLRGLMEGRRLREMGGRELMRGDGSLDRGGLGLGIG